MLVVVVDFITVALLLQLETNKVGIYYKCSILPFNVPVGGTHTTVWGTLVWACIEPSCHEGLVFSPQAPRGV